MKPTVLLIDDDPIDLKAMELLMGSWDMDSVSARSAEAGLAVLDDQVVDLVISDVCMPGLGGEEVVAAVRKRDSQLPVVLITGQGDVRSAVTAIHRGAFDYVLKPPDEDELRLTVDRALEHAELRRENGRLRAALAAGGRYGERLLGRSPAMLAVFERISRVAPTDSTVLITGETGTGKEVVAQTIHYKSRRADGPFIACNCAALNPNLIESELFGHEKGAFTGAVAARRGRFEEADGGTLFLDEIGEVNLEFQAKLLRAIQEREIERVGGGGGERIGVDVRLIVSTNRDLAADVAAGRFREDLFYRLRVIPIELPPLRERRDDIPLLAQHFLDRYDEAYHCGITGLSDDARAYLRAQAWRGNVRELQHAIERAVVLADAGLLTAASFTEPEAQASPGEDQTLQACLDRHTQTHILAVLDATGWRKQRAADMLGIDRATLYRLMKKFRLTKS